MFQSVKQQGQQAIIIALLAVLSFANVPAFAQSPSPAQMAAFQSLSPAEQQRLAKQYGVEVPGAGATPAAPAVPQTIGKGVSESAIADLALEAKEGEYVLAQQNIIAEQESEKVRPPLRYFGYDVFAGKPTSFSPIGDLPVPLDYIVGPGDEISIQLFGKENARYLLTVGRDGAIDMPNLGPISVAGSSFKQLKEDLALRIKKQIIGAEVSIGMGELRLMQVYVLGDAANPGAYNLSSLATVSQALIAAGGIAETGSLRKIEVRRGNQRIAMVDLYDLLIRGDLGNDTRLQSGDAVFVHPVGQRVAVDGEVLRPAVYEVKSKTTLNDIINIAGGLLPEAFKTSVQIKRQTDEGIQVLSQDLDQARGQRYQLQSGDSVFVKQRNTGFRKQIVLTGAFVQPGRRGFYEGMRISDALGNIDASLRDDADLSIGLIVREVNQQISVRYIDITQLRENASPAQNLALAEGDELIIFPGYLAYKGNNKQADAEVIAEKRRALLEPILEKIRLQARLGETLKIVEISGPVRYPGVYPYETDMPLQRLLLLAGSVKETSDKQHLELSRISNVNGAVSLSHINLSLQDTASHEHFILMPRDRVNVFENDDWKNVSTLVSLTGEVQYPGDYIVSRGTTIKDLINRAGGMTEYAFPAGAVLTRESLKEREAIQIRRLRDRLQEEVATMSLRKSTPTSGLSVSPSEASDTVEKISTTQALGRLVIDLPALLSDNARLNVQLVDEDELHIPAHRNTVTVVGEVQYPSSHLYEGGLSYKNYVSRAGGIRQRADEGRIYIIRANGEVALPKNSWFGIAVQEGDTIVVPIDTEYTDTLTVFSTVTQILYQLGIAYDVIAK